MTLLSLGVIPARFQSTRLPAKPLADIHGKPMVQWVYEAAKKALPRVVVATDDQRIAHVVSRFGGEALMTSKKLNSGTERMAAVARIIRADYYINIQGDEPLMNAQSIKIALNLSRKKKSIATVATELKESDFMNPSAVKVIIDKFGKAIYFSRSPIPYKAHGVSNGVRPYKHLGLYVYPRKELSQFVRWKPSLLEQTEKLEQLRALYYGAPIFVAFTPFDSIGVDTPTDLRRVRELMGCSISKKRGAK